MPTSTARNTFTAHLMPSLALLALASFGPGCGEVCSEVPVTTSFTGPNGTESVSNCSGPPSGAADIESLVSEDALQSMEDNGLRVHRGENPPEIDGSYLMDTHVLGYDSEGILPGGYPFGRYLFDMRTAEDGSILVDYENLDSGTTGAGEPGFATGADGCITIWSNSLTQQTDCQEDLPNIYTGCLSEEGLEDFQHVIHMHTREGACNASMMSIGSYRILEEEDQLAALQ